MTNSDCAFVENYWTKSSAVRSKTLLFAYYDWMMAPLKSLSYMYHSVVVATQRV